MLISAAALGCCAGVAGADTTWLNSGDSWSMQNNWSGGLPDLQSAALLPAATTRVDPLISGNISVLGLRLDNTNGAYAVLGGGTLTLLGGGISVSGGGTSNFSVATVLQAGSFVDVDANSFARFTSPFDTRQHTFEKRGQGTLILDASVNGVLPNQPVTISAGTLRLTRNGTLGTTLTGGPVSRGITIQPGATLELQTADTDLTLGDPDDPLGTGASMLLKGNAVIRALPGASTTHYIKLGGGRSPRLANGSSPIIEARENTNIINLGALGNEVNQISDSGAVLHTRGSGVIQFVHATSGANAFTGDVEVDMTDDQSQVGATVMHDSWALGHRTNGRYAGVRLKSGYFVDAGSTPDDPFDGSVTFNGGLLGQTATIAPLPRARAFYTGNITVGPQGGAVNLRDIFNPGVNLAAEFEGKFTGSGALEVIADANAPTPGILQITRTSTNDPNDFNGTVMIRSNAQLHAIAVANGSNPLGSATVALAGGELRLSHPVGAGTINTFADNSLRISGADGPVSTLTLDTGSTPTTVQLKQIVSPADGGARKIVVSGSALANHTARFINGAVIDGATTFDTNSSRPADVIIASNLSGSGELIKSGNNTLTLTAPTTAFTGTVTASQGTIALANSAQLNRLRIEPAAAVRLAPSGRQVLRLEELVMPTDASGAGRLDLSDNDLIVNDGNVAVIRTLLTSGQLAVAGSDGITTSDNDLSKSHGHATAAQLGVTQFRGEKIFANDVIVRFTFNGDANLDGRVNTVDFNRLAGGFGGTAPDWFAGDFNYDSLVNSLDFALLASNHGKAIASEDYLWPAVPESLSGTLTISVSDLPEIDRLETARGITFDASLPYRAAPASDIGTVVPEPGVVGFVLGTAMGLLRRRRRLTPQLHSS